MREIVKKMGKVTLLASVLLMAVQPAWAFAADKPAKVKSLEMSLQFDGKTLKLPDNQYLFIINNTSYVPVRFMSYALQQSVVWDAKSKTVVIKEPTSHEKTTLNERLLNSLGKAGEPSTVGGQALSAVPVDAKFQFNGVNKPIPTGLKAYNLNGSIYVPVRFLSESIGTQINWDKKSGSISGESAAYKEAQQNQNGNGTKEPEQPTQPTQPATKPTYESITSSAESRLYTLRDSCKNQLIPLGLSLYSSKGNDAEVQRYVNEINGVISSCTTQFNSLISDVESQLTSNGYSTAVLADYRKAFQDELDAGRALLESMG